MRIESNTSAVVYGNNYKPKNQEEAKADLPTLNKQLASQEEDLSNLLKKIEGFPIEKFDRIALYLGTK